MTKKTVKAKSKPKTKAETKASTRTKKRKDEIDLSSRVPYKFIEGDKQKDIEYFEKVKSQERSFTARDIAHVLSSKTNISRDILKVFVTNIFNIVADALVNDNVVHMNSIGKLKLVDLKPRTFKSFSDGKIRQSSKKKRVRFIPVFELKKRVDLAHGENLPEWLKTTYENLDKKNEIVRERELERRAQKKAEKEAEENKE